jgi:hypothetical protein
MGRVGRLFYFEPMMNAAESGAEPEDPRKRLTALRSALLGLHKTLVDSERVSYEKIVGEIKSANHFLQLLISDPWFAWLHPLSQLIVSMDEALNENEPLTVASVNGFATQSSRLLVASEQAEGFSGHYFEALQRDPDVVLAHAETVRLWGPRKPPEGPSKKE